MSKDLNNAEELRWTYLNWLCDKVYDDRYGTMKYDKMFVYLYETPFDYTLPMDGNRAEDGVNLRYRFGRENRIPDYKIASFLDDRPCSVLEMMVALAVRMETHIMDNPDVGDRVGQWFWDMIVSLDINMPDSRFDYHHADRVMDIFMNRKYKRNGEGGLFTIHDPSKDMRTTEIWYQMCFYLNEMIGD